MRYLKMLGLALMAVGAVLVFPAVGAGILGAIGIGPGGVGLATPAAGLQAAIYGGATGGVFAALQSFAATVVVSPLTTAAGIVLGLAGAALWFL